MEKRTISHSLLSRTTITVLTGLNSTSLLLSGAFLATATSAQAQNLKTSGDINTAANWDTGTLPALGKTGTVNIDSSWPKTSRADALAIFGDLVFGGGCTLTAEIDVVGFNPSKVTFNDVTVNVGDDILPGGAKPGHFIFNAGSVTNVDDDFEANGGGSITINGGTHTVGLNPTGDANFGAQLNSTLNFFGGTVTTDAFRTAKGTINLGGTATLSANTISLEGNLNIAADWTGSLTILGVDWETLLINAATFNGAAIDATVFSEHFVVKGDTLSLIEDGATISPSKNHKQTGYEKTKHQ